MICKRSSNFSQNYRSHKINFVIDILRGEIGAPSTGFCSSVKNICFKTNSFQYDSCGYAAHEQGFTQMKAFFNDKCWVTAVDRLLI
jgi:pyruvate carboxylase